MQSREEELQSIRDTGRVEKERRHKWIDKIMWPLPQLKSINIIIKSVSSISQKLNNLFWLGTVEREG